MFSTVIERAKAAAKAIVAAATPIVAVAVADILAELSVLATGAVAAAATAITVYLVPNKATD